METPCFSFGNGMKRLLLVITLFVCVSACEAQGQNNRLLSDKELFQVLNLDYPGLEAVKGCVERGDIKNAKRELVVYYKNRTSPKWYFSCRDFAPTKGFTIKQHIKEYADRHVNNELLAHGTWHQYGETIDWTEDHSYDHYDEWVWQLNIHYCWVNLADAYWATGDEKYAKAFVRQLNGWIDQCSKLSDYWNGVGSVWRPLDAGQRMMNNWPTLFYRFLVSPSFDDESIIKMVKCFYQHAVHLRNHPTANNWLTLEMNGLFVVGGLFPEFKDAEGWRLFAANKLYEEEEKMFYPDGAQYELTPGYHAVSVSNISAVYRFSQLNGYHLPDGFVNRIVHSYEYFVKLRMPDGNIPALNDSEWIPSDQYIKEASELFPNRKDFKYFASKGKDGALPSYTSVWMPWAGWYVMRSGWGKDAFYALFEVGPYGAVHQHEDKLSFILYAYGKRLITEAGYYPYDQSEWRKFAKSARGHNVARVDGKDQNREALKNNDEILYSRQPLDNNWTNKRKYEYGEGSYTEGYGPLSDKTVTHYRSLKFVKNKYWVVTDTFTPSDTLNHTYDTWFHFSTPSYEMDDKFGIVYSDEQNSANIAIIALSGLSTVKVFKGQKTPEIQGWLPVVGGGNGFHCEHFATPSYRISGKGVVQESYLFIPYKANEPMPVKGVKKISRKKYKLYLESGGSYTVKL